VRCELDPHSYPKGITVSDQEMAALNITRAAFRGEWNYTIRPSTAFPWNDSYHAAVSSLYVQVWITGSRLRSSR
jgi:hypothetical protein